MSLWFVAGMLAAVNPCGFILLPTYLMYFLGLQGGQQPETLTQRQTLRRALKVSASLSAGFMAVFIVAAGLANYFTNWLTENAKYATGFFGVALLALGGAMLFGYKLPFMNPTRLQGEKDQTFRSMFIYGVAYAIASLGCTIGFFISAVFATSRSGGVFTGLRNGLAYGAGMAILVSGLTVALAFANTGLLKFLRRGLQYMDRIAAAFVLISGVYLLWYFYWVDLKEEGDAITDWVTFRQADVNTYLNNHQWGVTVVLFTLLGSTVAYVYTRRADVLAGLVIGGAAVAGVISSDWVAVSIIGAATAVAGVLGLMQDRRDARDARSTGDGTDADPDSSTYRSVSETKR